MKAWNLALLTAVALWWSGCGSTLDAPDNEKTANSELVVDMPANMILKSLMDRNTTGIDENTTVFGYKAYKIEYETVDEQGLPVTASGLMVIPTDNGVKETDAQKLAYMQSKGLSVVSDSHGTIFADIEAPTVAAEATLKPQGAPVIFTSLAGFVTLQADYIGFGSSADHYHPYLLKSSSAAATVDFIKAAKKFAEEKGIPLNGQLFVTGYSEGGYVALATLEELEEEGERVDMAIPMAGPYMLDRMAVGVLSSPELPIPSFMANVAYAYALSYEHPVSELINEPYASTLPDLLNGSLDRQAIDARLPHVTSELFTSQAISQVLESNASYWFNQALFGNSTAYWGPQTTVKLVHCLGDDVVPYAMSQGTADLMMQRLGARDVEAIPVEIAVTRDSATPVRWGHVECAAYAYGVAAKIFGDVRARTVGY